MISSRKGKKEKKNIYVAHEMWRDPDPESWWIRTIRSQTAAIFFFQTFGNDRYSTVLAYVPFSLLFFFFLKIIYSLPDLFFFSKFNLCSVCSSFLIPRITVSVFLLMAVLNGDHLFSGSSSSSSLTEIA